jgi:hypothetical protein
MQDLCPLRIHDTPIDREGDGVYDAITVEGRVRPCPCAAIDRYHGRQRCRRINYETTLHDQEE